MNGSVSVFSRAMERFRFVEPVPPEVQRHIRRVKRREFLKILRRAGAYSTLFAIVSSVFFTLKKLGVSITIAKAAMLIGVSALLLFGGAASSVYYAVRALTAPDSEIRVQSEESGQSVASSQALVSNATAPTAATDPPELVERRFGVQGFTAANVDPATAARVSGMVASELAKLKGGERVIRGASKDRKAGMLVLGSVEELGGAYDVTARVVSVKDGRILFYSSETAGSAAELDGAAVRLSRKIAAGIR